MFANLKAYGYGSLIVKNRANNYYFSESSRGPHGNPSRTPFGPRTPVWKPLPYSAGNAKICGFYSRGESAPIWGRYGGFKFGFWRNLAYTDNSITVRDRPDNVLEDRIGSRCRWVEKKQVAVTFLHRLWCFVDRFTRPSYCIKYYFRPGQTGSRVSGRRVCAQTVPAARQRGNGAVCTTRA